MPCTSGPHVSHALAAAHAPRWDAFWLQTMDPVHPREVSEDGFLHQEADASCCMQSFARALKSDRARNGIPFLALF